LKKAKAQVPVSPAAALPATPQTEESTPPPDMDSDDDFMSGASSQDFDNNFDSDDGSVIGTNISPLSKI
jgi:hypothetical protein